MLLGQIHETLTSNQAVEENLLGAAFKSSGNYRMFADCLQRIAPWFKQSSGRDRGIKHSGLGHCFQIETNDHNAAVNLVSVNECGY